MHGRSVGGWWLLNAAHHKTRQDQQEIGSKWRVVRHCVRFAMEGKSATSAVDSIVKVIRETHHRKFTRNNNNYHHFCKNHFWFGHFLYATTTDDVYRNWKLGKCNNTVRFMWFNYAKDDDGLGNNAIFKCYDDGGIFQMWRWRSAREKEEAVFNLGTKWEVIQKLRFNYTRSTIHSDDHTYFERSVVQPLNQRETT